MEDHKIKVVFVGIRSEVSAVSEQILLASSLSDGRVVASDPQGAIELLTRGERNCVFLDPLAFKWRDTKELLQFCTLTFPVCLLAPAFSLFGLEGVSPDWKVRLREYYQVASDSSLPELREQLSYAIRGCHRYLLKRVVRGNIGQIASQALSEPVPGLVADKAREAVDALTAIEAEEKSRLGDSLGLTGSQMRVLFNDALDHARQTARRSEWANLATLGIGLSLVLAVALAALIRQSADAWSVATGGMGAAAVIAALVTSPGRQITSGALRLIFIQTAYFSFLSQVRLLSVPGPDSSLQRSERLERATTTLLEQLKTMGSDS